MRSINFILYLILILLMGACGAAPTENAVPIPTAEATLAPPTIISPTSMNSPVLEAGQWTHIFYHDGLEQVVMVNGGPEHGKPAEELLELWGWDGAQWSLISADTSGPTWRNWAAVAYDSGRDVLVIHGGIQGQNYFNETWEWDGQDWKLFTNTSAREGAVMVYDSARAKTLLFGGSDAGMEIHGSTWEWDGQTWTMVSESGPAARFPAGMVFDPVSQEVLMYSGHFASPSGEAINYDDLWAWDGNSWREIITEGPTPGLRTHAGFVYDPVTEKILLIGSGSEAFLSDVWSWDGSKWEEIPASNTPARSGHTVAYDPKRDRFVLFGGVDRPGSRALDDTWEWDRVQWSCISKCQ